VWRCTARAALDGPEFGPRALLAAGRLPLKPMLASIEASIDRGTRPASTGRQRSSGSSTASGCKRTSRTAKVRLFTRSLDDITTVSEVVTALAALPVRVRRLPTGTDRAATWTGGLPFHDPRPRCEARSTRPVRVNRALAPCRCRFSCSTCCTSTRGTSSMSRDADRAPPWLPSCRRRCSAPAGTNATGSERRHSSRTPSARGHEASW